MSNLDCLVSYPYDPTQVENWLYTRAAYMILVSEVCTEVACAKNLCSTDYTVQWQVYLQVYFQTPMSVFIPTYPFTHNQLHTPM